MFRDLLRQKLAGIAPITEEQIIALEAHYQLMVRWNKSLSLTTIVKAGEASERHYCESVFLAHHLSHGPLKIADIGSGPGFPGIPIAIYRPDIEVTLIESHQRKAVFLREATRGLSNVRVLAKRAEDIREHFDRVVSRAVSFDDLGLPLRNLTKSADLLTGIESPPATWGWEWEVVKLPWGKERYLRHGQSFT